MSSRRAIERMLSGPASDLELDRACLLIAAEEYPELSVDVYLAELDRLAARVRESLPSDAGPEETVLHLRRVLAQEEGFDGNRSEYYDARNSYLNEVLERRTGIPITLSVIYIEVARRLGVTLAGIGFPGHFLVGRDPGSDRRLIIDPFNEGRALGESELRELLASVFGDRLPYSPALLAPVGPHQLLFRLLNNLKNVYLRQEDLVRALGVVERMMLAVPEAHFERRDRGMLLARLGRPLQALQELARFRDLVREDEGQEAIDALILQLRGDLARRN